MPHFCLGVELAVFVGGCKKKAVRAAVEAEWLWNPGKAETSW